LDTGGGDDQGQHQPECIDEEMVLAAFYLFIGGKAAELPFSMVLTD
jgi:hypothetical protein